MNLCWPKIRKLVRNGALTTVVAENMLYLVYNTSWASLREVTVANTLFYTKFKSFSVIFLIS